jgi:hypothetical protein
MSTMFDIMIATLRLLGGLRTGSASAGNTTSLTDTSLRKEDDDFWNGGTIWVLSAGGAAPEGEYSLITNFGSGVFTFNALTAVIENGDKYAASEGKYPYDILMDAVNLAISQYRYPRIDVTLTTEADKTEYALPTAVQHGRLREVYRSTQADADDRQFEKIAEWWTVDTGSSQLLILPDSLAAGKTLRLDYDLVHTDFDAGTDTLYEILEPKHIIYRAAEYMILQQMYDGDEWPYLEERMNYFIDKADRYEAEFLEVIKQHRRE